VCFQVEVSALGRSLVRWSPTECGVSEYHSEASILRRPWPTGSCCAMIKKNMIFVTAGFILLCGCCWFRTGVWLVVVGFMLLCGCYCRFRAVTWW